MFVGRKEEGSFYLLDSRDLNSASRNVFGLMHTLMLIFFSWFLEEVGFYIFLRSVAGLMVVMEAIVRLLALSLSLLICAQVGLFCLHGASYTFPLRLPRLIFLSLLLR